MTPNIKKKAIIFGATSGIGKALVSQLAGSGYFLILVARDGKELQRISSDIFIRFNCISKSYAIDLEMDESLPEKINEIIASYPDIGEFYFLVGYLGNQKLAEESWYEREKIVRLNYEIPIQIISQFAGYFAKKGEGIISVIGSVAGDRGRRSNYFYGSAKAGLHAYLSGLRSKLANSNVHVLTVKPGFVDTGMTFGMPGLFLVALPEKVAHDILKGVDKRKNMIYTPFFWRWIMLLIRSIPESVFKKLPI